VAEIDADGLTELEGLVVAEIDADGLTELDGLCDADGLMPAAASVAAWPDVSATPGQYERSDMLPLSRPFEALVPQVRFGVAICRTPVIVPSETPLI
jgi:hypothetical protein